MTRRLRRYGLRALAFASVAASLAGCGAARQPDSSVPMIVGGQPVPAGAWPSVVGLAWPTARPDGFLIECTGTLVAPSVVLTAGHCLDAGAPARVYTGLGAEGGVVPAPHQVARVVTHPLLRAHPLGYADFGLVFLAEPVTDVATVPLVTTFADELELTRQGAVTLVGYGRREDDGQGVKYFVETTLADATSHEAVAGGEGRDACEGDSGGPAFARKADGSWRQLGVVSRGVRLGCGEGGYVELAADATCWIEGQTGLSLPGAACGDDVPAYDDAALRAMDVRALCEDGRATATQRETLEHVRLGLGLATCADAAETLATAKELDLDWLMLRDASPLAGAAKVERLSLRGNRLRDVAALGYLPALKTVRLEGNDVASFAPLAGVKVTGKRRQLSNYQDTAFLAQCRDAALPDDARKTVRAVLWTTMAESCEQANVRLLGIKALALRERGLTSLAPLAGLEHLVRLDLADNPVTDVAPLAGMESLKQLRLKGTGVHDLTPLQGLLDSGLSIEWE